MKECAFHETLTMAENACANAIKNRLPEDLPMFRFENPGRTDCAVFDIGSPRTGDLFAVKAKSLHYRGKLTLYRRDHDHLQQTIMSLVETFPVNADFSADHELRETSNVELLRIAPESGCISEIMRETVATHAGEVATCSVTIAFDVVFAVRFD